jgi:RNA polymerase sigma-70 factor (ECF subfamily)
MTKEPSVEGDTGTVNAFHPGPEMLNKLESLPVDERFAVVMHVIYAMPIADVARLLATTPANARLVAGRAVQAMHPMGEHFDPDVDRGRVESFLIASESGTFEQMVTLLKPDAVITADQAAVQMGALPEITGAAHVARRFFGRATGIRLAMINGLAGAILAPGDEVVIVFRFHYLGEKVARIDLIADPNTLRTLDVCVLEPESREHVSE